MSRQYSQYSGRSEIPFRLKVAAGKVPGWRAFRKFGANPTIASGTEYMWPLGTVPYFDAGVTAYAASLVSSSAEDDENEATPPGTGAFEVTVEGLDGDLNEVSETIALSGLTPVNTTQTFRRIHRIYVGECGTTEDNVGNITAQLNSQNAAYIPAERGQTQQAFYTVPAGHTFFIDNYRHGTGRSAGNVDLSIEAEIRLNAGVNGEGWRTISDVYDYQTNYGNDASMTALPEKTDARVRIIGTASTQGFAIFSGFLVDNDYL